MLIDCHTHVHFSAFEGETDSVIKRALDAGVSMITVGTQQDTSAGAVATAKKYPGKVWASIGLHPIHTDKSYHDENELGGGEHAKAFYSRGETFDANFYDKLAKDPAVVAIGECGLDYYRMDGGDVAVKEKQKTAFLAQASIAMKHGKALMIHCRPSKGTDDAYSDLYAILSDPLYHGLRKVVHFYVGSPAITQKLVEAGFYFTLGGVITFADDYNESIKLMPMDRILLETDAPYVAPKKYRGKKNEPAFIVETAKKLAEIKGVSYATIEKTTTDNAVRVFNLNLN